MQSMSYRNGSERGAAMMCLINGGRVLDGRHSEGGKSQGKASEVWGRGVTDAGYDDEEAGGFGSRVLWAAAEMFIVILWTLRPME